jgi:hypothetical protein
VEAAAGGFSREWGPVARDLVQIGRGRVRISERLREALAAGLAAAPYAGDRTALGLAVIAEMAALVGDALRGRAQAEILTRSGAESSPSWPDPAAPGERGGAERARDITAGIEALLTEAGR